MNLFTQLFKQTPEQAEGVRLAAQIKKSNRAAEAFIDNVELDALPSLEEQETKEMHRFVRGDNEAFKRILLLRKDRELLLGMLEQSRKLKDQLFDDKNKE